MRCFTCTSGVWWRRWWGCGWLRPWRWRRAQSSCRGSTCLRTCSRKTAATQWGTTAASCSFQCWAAAADEALIMLLWVHSAAVHSLWTLMVCCSTLPGEGGEGDGGVRRPGDDVEEDDDQSDLRHLPLILQSVETLHGVSTAAVTVTVDAAVNLPHSPENMCTC